MDGHTRVDHACVAGSSGDHLACFAQGHDYIGPDPVRWLERLLDVNEGSHFTAGQKQIIALRLDGLRRELQTIVRVPKERARV